jgi:hypothetical protein
MDYLHQEFDAGPEDVIEVTLDHAANVLVLDSLNYSSYRGRKPYKYYGGYVTSSPYRISPPHNGHWHVVIDLGGYAGTVRATMRVLSHAS